jgi:hypothetical protein
MVVRHDSNQAMESGFNESLQFVEPEHLTR